MAICSKGNQRCQLSGYINMQYYFCFFLEENLQTYLCIYILFLLYSWGTFAINCTSMSWKMIFFRKLKICGSLPSNVSLLLNASGLCISGLLNRLLWMQGVYPLCGEEFLLFKTSISFIDHLQEFLSALLTGCTLVIPPFQELKNNPLSLVDYLKVNEQEIWTYGPMRLKEVVSKVK